MSLGAGTRLGAYEIVSSLGAGGMGEVYRARDTRLGRDVAIKVLRELHRELLERASHSYVPLAHIVLTAEAAGQHEDAMAFARRAWDEREPPFILWARHFPFYRPLHSDPRFAAILREMDAPEQNEVDQS